MLKKGYSIVYKDNKIIKDINLLNEVIEKYGHSTDRELSMWTKSQFPYKSVYDSNEMWHTITTLSIAKYFKGLWNI